MSSLQEHLDRHDRGTRPLAFRRDCPVCRAERLHGQLPSASLVSPRARAAITAAVLATNAIAPGTAAASDGQGVTARAPASPPPPQASDVAVESAGGAAPVDRPARERGDAGDRRPGQVQRSRDRAQAGSAPAGDRPSRRAPSSGPPSQPAGDRATRPGGARDETPTPAETPPTPTETPTPTGAHSHDSTPAANDDATPEPRPSAPRTVLAPAPASDQHAPAAHAEPQHRQATSTRGSRAAPATEAAVATDAPHGSGGVTRRTSRPDVAPANDSAARAAHARQRARETNDGLRSGSHDERETLADAPAGARAPTTRAAHAKSARPVTYRVRSGDSLWRIAERRIGSGATAAATAEEVTRLWELNRERIGTGNPDLIFPGQTLRM